MARFFRAVLLVVSTSAFGVAGASGADPVGGRPLSTETLALAREAGRPVALLATRRACPRCRALERALAEPRVSAVLEGRYTWLSLDADERPDVAGGLADGLLLLPEPRLPPDPGVSALLIATPDLRPLDGTSLLREGRALDAESVLAFLVRRADAWEADRSALELRGGLALAALREAQAPSRPSPELQPSLLDRPLRGLRESYDPRRAGFGRPPRRIPHGPLRLLLAEHERTGDAGVLALATSVLDALLASPLRGPGGGFFREARGDDWGDPVFELSLADNALLLRALLAAHEATGRPAYAEAAAGIAAFLRGPLAEEAGGFRHAIALERRDGPAERDDRVFAYANALALSALARSGRVLGRAEDVASAVRAAERISARLGPPRSLARLADGADRRGSALPADHVFLAEAMLDLHEATGAARWRDEARAAVEAALARYADGEGGYFESAEDGEPRPARRRDAYDGLLPAPNAVMVSVLHRLGRATGETVYAGLARRTALAFGADLSRAPRGLESLAASVAELLGPARGARESAAAPAAPRVVSGKVAFEAVVEPGRLAAGAKARVVVRLVAEPGTHVVAHQPFATKAPRGEGSDLLPLVVAFPGRTAAVGVPVYPAGTPVVLPGSTAPVLAHSGAAEVSAVLTASLGAGEKKLAVRVAFQVCEARGCAAPDSVLLEAPFTVAP